MSTESGAATVRVDGLRKFPELVTRLGGNPRTLLTKSQIDPTVLHNRHAVIPYRSLVMLLERSAHELNCPDFGMRLAMAQGGLKVLGPLEFAMRNSGTIREAFQYCASHPQVYSTASQMRFETERSCDPSSATGGIPRETARAPESVFLRFEILLHRLPPHAQAIERALLLTQLVTLDISRDRIRAREIWLTHDPLVPEDRYREHFGVNVRFRQPVNGLFFANSDLDMPIPNIDAQLYELTTDFIENRFPSASAPLSTRVRTIIERLLIQGDCNYGSVSATLGMHPRTLQRRLRAENESFESIKDSVRREVALRYLKQSSLPLIRVAKLLGYSETSALSRSCYRWFSASPRQLRSGVDMMNGDDLRTKQSA